MSKSSVNAAKDEYRVIRFGASVEAAEHGFCDNFVVTSKYTLLSFLPKFLFESFRKLANFYFLVVCILQCIPQISNTSGQPSTLPALAFIIAVDAVLAILEDHKRHIADNIANYRLTSVLNRQSHDFQNKRWADVAVGDIVKLCNRDSVPADLLLLAVSEVPDAPPAGVCYVETKSLDGETNLKVRSAMECTLADMGTSDNLLGMSGCIRCEHPNNAINSFQGVLELDGKGKQSIPYESILLRGCTVRSTDWIHGMVINTGKDTKIMMSNSAPPSKMSTMDQAINQYIVKLLVMLIVFSAIGSTGTVLSTLIDKLPWYLQLETSSNSIGVDWVIMFFYYLLLMYQFVPISLCVSVSMVKYLQAMFIQWDINIYHEETDTPALVRSMSLNEELGQISYIFSDKTGTLTCNVMEFRKCSIGGISYGKGTTEIGLAALRRAGKPLPEPSRSSTANPVVPYVNFEDPRMTEDMNGKSGDEQKARIAAFFTHLAVCHTVIPEHHEGSSEVTLSASSPDEQALVAGAAYFGYSFINRCPGVAQVEMNGKIHDFEVMDVLEFTSARKRMSTVVRHPDGSIVLYTKGADVIVLDRLQIGTSPSSPREGMKEATYNHVNQYAEDGLRTLTIAKRDLDPAYYIDWARRFHAAQNNLDEINKRKREETNAIDSCMDEIETGLELLGATAIEDKLQEGVPDTIANLSEAGIRVWVLTGDKEETAINIGFACQLLTNDMEIVTINAHNAPNAERVRKLLKENIELRALAVDAYLSAPTSTRGGLKGLALVIDGETLYHALSGACRPRLAEFSQYCKAVIACRVSPAQKAQMAALIKEYVPTARTLSIGDGANDVSMIQEAHIGVGISGQEGMQAVNSSDYAIARFRYLKRLLLVHGRWNYRRTAQLVLYIFYKNILFTAAQYWYAFYCEFTGQKFFLEAGVQLYNIWFTAVPVVALSILDQDVDADVVLQFPKLYYSGPRDRDLNAKIFTLWVLEAVVESILIALVTFIGMEYDDVGGATTSMWLYGNVIFTLIVIVANLKLALFQNSFLAINYVLYIASFVSWVVVGLVSEQITLLSGLSWEHVMGMTMTSRVFWLLGLLVTVISLLPTFARCSLKTMLYPEYWQITKEVVKFQLDRNKLVYEDTSDAAVEIPVKVNKKRNSRIASIAPGRRDDEQVASTNSESRHSYQGFAFATDARTNEAEAQLVMKRGSVMA